MKLRIILVIILLIVAWVLPSSAFAIDHAWAAPIFIDNECSILILIYGKDKTLKITYKGEYFDKELCTVNVANNEFEKHFKYCFPSAIRVDKKLDKYVVNFGGGPAGGRNKYWFEWGPPQYVRPTFHCTLRNDM